MAWATAGSTALTEGSSTYGYVKLQYDDTSTGSSRSCRLQFDLNSGSSVYIYFNNVAIDGSVKVSQTLVQGSVTLWSGTLSGGASHSFSWSCPWYSGTRSYSGSGTIPSGATAPTGLAVSVSSVTDSSATCVVSITNWGSGATSDRYLEPSISAEKNTDAHKRRYQHGTHGSTSLSQTIVCSNNSSGAMPIMPNTLYYVGSYATNGAASTGVQWNGGSTVTMCKVPTDIELRSTTYSGTTASAVIRVYKDTNEGGYYSPTLQTRYSTNGGSTWSSWASQGTFTTATKDVTLTGLPLNTDVQVQARISTTAGTTSAITCYAHTTGPTARFYIRDSSGKTKQAGKVYVRSTSTGKTTLAGKIYANQNDKTARVFGRP